MGQVVVPVRYPLTDHSRGTLAEAADIAEGRETTLTVLHVNLYQDEQTVTRGQLESAVEEAFGSLPRTRYVVRTGFLVEETILEEAATEGTDLVVIGEKQVGRWRRMLRRLVDVPDIERFLNNKLDCQVVTVSVSG